MNPERKKKLDLAEHLLISCGIDKDLAPDVLQAVGAILTGRNIYSEELDNRQDICNALRDVLLLTHNAGGTSNPLKELKYIPETEKVRPIFENGAGADGYYDVDVCADSGTAVIFDIARQFIKTMW